MTDTRARVLTVSAVLRSALVTVDRYVMADPARAAALLVSALLQVEKDAARLAASPRR